jgi:hypothetical protein
VIFRAIDVNSNGSIYYDDLLAFFLEHKESNTSLMFLIANQAKLLEATGLETE